MATNPISQRLPEFDLETPEGRVRAHRYNVSGIVDLNQAIASLKQQVDAKTVTTTTTVISGGGGGSAPTPFPFPGLGAIRNETGSTSYTIQSTDNGAIVVLSDASPVAVSLNSALTVPFFFFATNLGAGLVTFTPTTGLINGSATATMATGYMAIIAFDGTNWTITAQLIIPVNTPAVSHQFFTAYNSATGAFTQAQPVEADVVNLVSDLAAKAPIASPTFTGTVTQPDATVLTAATVAVTATAGASTLPATPQQFLTVHVNGSSYKIPLYLP